MTDAELTDLRRAWAEAKALWDAAERAADLACAKRQETYVAWAKLDKELQREELHRAWLREYESGLRGEPAPAAPKETPV